jgi:hypothetical protein
VGRIEKGPPYQKLSPTVSKLERTMLNYRMANENTEDEVVDMNELQKNEDTTIEDEAEKEPDSELEDEIDEEDEDDLEDIEDEE